MCPFNCVILAAENISPVNVDFYLKDELEFEVRSRGSKPQGDVASLREQRRWNRSFRFQTKGRGHGDGGMLGEVGGAQKYN